MNFFVGNWRWGNILDCIYGTWEGFLFSNYNQDLLLLRLSLHFSSKNPTGYLGHSKGVSLLLIYNYSILHFGLCGISSSHYLLQKFIITKPVKRSQQYFVSVELVDTIGLCGTNVISCPNPRYTCMFYNYRTQE
jgi:hypothetical protein